MESQVTKRSLKVIVGYLLLAVLLSAWFTLARYKNGIDPDDGSRLTASSLLAGVGTYGAFWVVVALPALILGMMGGWWAAMAHRVGEGERNRLGDRKEANL